MDKCKVQEIIRSYPTKKSMLQDKQAELIQLIHERESEIGSLPCTLGRTEGGGNGVSDTTYRKVERAIRHDPEITTLSEAVEELRGEVDKIDMALAQLDPVSKRIVELREMPRYNNKRGTWERTRMWGEIADDVYYSIKQCQRMYNAAIDIIGFSMSRNVAKCLKKRLY